MTVKDAPPVVLRGKKIIDTVHQYFLNKAKADKLEAENKALKEQILEAMDGNPVASVGTHVVRVTESAGTPATPNKVITRDMIGQVIPGSKGRSGSTRIEVI